MRSAVGLCVLLFVIASPRSSSAQTRETTHPSVSLDVDPCVEADRDEVRRIVGIELGALLTGAAPSAGTGAPARSSDTTRVTVTCMAPFVELRVDDPITGKALTRTVDLSASSAAARSRLVALAIAELVSASWTELESSAQPGVAPARPPPSAASREAASHAVRSRAAPLASQLRLMLALEVRGWLPKTAPALGAGLRAVELRPKGFFGWSLDLMGAHGKRSVGLGEISFDTVSLGASMFAYRSWSRWSLRGGPGIRLGIARISGEAASDAVQRGSVIGPWGGPMANASVSLTPWSGVVFEIAAEGGYGLLSVRGRAAGIREVAIAGPWLAGGVSLGFFR